MVEYFSKPGSIVRQIWGKADTVLFIFAGASAEFALNNAVDWLYFTGKLPADPLGRLFSTVEYAARIVFSKKEAAYHAIDQINHIHQHVEIARGAQIPDWAYRDVLFMLIDHSIRAYELLERKLSHGEKKEVYITFYQMGVRMQIPGLPATYREWVPVRQQHLNNNLQYSTFTRNLYQQYRKHLGYWRYQLLKQVQVMMLPEQASKMLKITGFSWLKPVIALYKVSRVIKLDSLAKAAILPAAYKAQIKRLDVATEPPNTRC